MAVMEKRCWRWFLFLNVISLMTSAASHGASFAGAKICDVTDPVVSKRVLEVGDLVACDMRRSFDPQDEVTNYTSIELGATDQVDTDGDGVLDCTVVLDTKVISIENNAVCAPTGLPCLVCRAGATDTDPESGLTCPGGVLANGVVRFRSDESASNECRLQVCPVNNVPLTCDGGNSGLEPCDTNADCPNGACLPASICESGDNIGNRCGQDSDCGSGVRCLPIIRDLFTSGGANGVNDPSGPTPLGATSVCTGGCPFVEIAVECLGVDSDGTCIGNLLVQAINNGEAIATNCEVMVFLDPDGDRIEVPLFIDNNPAAPFDLAPGLSIAFFPVFPLAETSEVEAVLICDEVPQCEPPDGQTTATRRTNCICPGGVDIDNFKCYAAKSEPGERFQRRTVELDDQFFEDRSAVVITPYSMCNPVDKNGEGILDEEAHLMCYKLRAKDRRRFRNPVIDRDQFSVTEGERLTIGSSALLCQPAIKNGEGDLEELEARLNHYQCYRARTERGAASVAPLFGQSLVDQFESKSTDLLQTSLHCNPTSKTFGNSTKEIPNPVDTCVEGLVGGDCVVDADCNSGEGISDGMCQPAHLKCYDIADSSVCSEPPVNAGNPCTDDASCDSVGGDGVCGQPPFRVRQVTIQDQFFPEGVQIRVGKPTHLCEPATKEVVF